MFVRFGGPSRDLRGDGLIGICSGRKLVRQSPVSAANWPISSG